MLPHSKNAKPPAIACGRFCVPCWFQTEPEKATAGLEAIPRKVGTGFRSGIAWQKYNSTKSGNRFSVRNCVVAIAGELLPCDNDRDQKIAPVAVAAVMTGGADQLHRNAGINRLHDGLVEAMQIIGNHPDNSLLVCIHGGSLFLSPFFYT
jgi:hypothetical protein